MFNSSIKGKTTICNSLPFMTHEDIWAVVNLEAWTVDWSVGMYEIYRSAMEMETKVATTRHVMMYTKDWFALVTRNLFPSMPFFYIFFPSRSLPMIYYFCGLLASLDMELCRGKISGAQWSWYILHPWIFPCYYSGHLLWLLLVLQSICRYIPSYYMLYQW